MQLRNRLLTAIVAAVGLVNAGNVQASPAAAREICRQFITRSGYVAQDWGEYWNWTTTDNKDGTWSVGARFMGAAPGGVVRNLYVNCTATKRGDQWTLQKLTRLQ